MKSESHEIKKAVETIGKEINKQASQNMTDVIAKMATPGVRAKDAMGISDQAIEGIYGQAYRLYNTGKYQDASQLFRLLVVLNGTEPKYALGLAACFHMMKEYVTAAEMYTLCGILDPNNPIPHYHASDCYIQLDDKISAVIALEMAVRRAGDRPEFLQLKDRALLSIESLKEEVGNPKEF